MLGRLRNKRGDTLLMVPVFLFLGLFLTALIMDFGMAFLAKAQVQNIADAAAIGGAAEGKYAYWSSVENRGIAVILKNRSVVQNTTGESHNGAEEEARDLLNLNLQYLPKTVHIESVTLNAPRDNLTSDQQYYNSQGGMFTVAADTNVDTVLLRQLPLGNALLQIPLLHFKSSSTVQVTPKEE